MKWRRTTALLRGPLCAMSASRMDHNMKTTFILFIVSALVGAVNLAPAQQAQSNVLAIKDVNLIDIRSGQLHPMTIVIVEKNRIVAIGPSTAVQIPIGAKVVNAHGKYLMPGLIDTHVHLSMPDEADTLAEFGWILAGGVTTFREAYSNEHEQKYKA